MSVRDLIWKAFALAVLRVDDAITRFDDWIGYSDKPDQPSTYWNEMGARDPEDDQ